jgi:hypothetical protein
MQSILNLATMLREMIKLLTFDDLECWLELNEEKPFTTIVVGTISISRDNIIIMN